MRMETTDIKNGNKCGIKFCEQMTKIVTNDGNRTKN